MTISIRLRLTLWSAAAVTMLLLAVAAALVLLQGRASLARLDAELQRVNATVAAVLQNELDEGLLPKAAAEDALAEVLVRDRHIAILSRDHTVLAARWTLSAHPLDGAHGRHVWTIDGGEGARAQSFAVPPVPDGFIVVAGASWDEIDDEREDLTRALATVITAALVLVAAGSWWVAGRALRPARRMAEEARQITERSPGRRLTVGRHDELGVLATAFNDLVARLEDALSERRQFLAEASHELRTPVSVARTAADVALSRPQRSQAEYREALTIVSRQMRHQGRLVSDMLALARSDASEWPLAPREFYFDELIGDVERAMKIAADERGVTIVCRCLRDLQIRGDEDLLTQMLTNLLENAIRHTPSGGRVEVDVSVDVAALRVRVRDTGTGVDAADRDRIFAPFVRVDPAADNTGMGLGLVIASRIARVHGGDVTLESTNASGTTFLITLPIAP